MQLFKKNKSIEFQFLSVASSRGDDQKMVQKVNLSRLMGPTSFIFIHYATYHNCHHYRY